MNLAWDPLLALQRATHATLHVLTTRLADWELSAAEINALGNLADGRVRTVSQLAADIGVRPTTVTGVLDRLQGKALITREALPTDRRAVAIRLTEAGEETASVVATAFREVGDAALARLSPDEVRVLRSGLEALAAAE